MLFKYNFSLVGLSKPKIKFNKVVPDPDLPTIAILSPLLIFKLRF